MSKQYKSVLAMVWDTSDTLSFKLRFTYVIFKQKIKKLLGIKL